MLNNSKHSNKKYILRKGAPITVNIALLNTNIIEKVLLIYDNYNILQNIGIQ